MDKCLFDKIFFFGTIGNVILYIIGCIVMTKLFATFGALFIISRLFDYSPSLGILLLIMSLYRYEEESNMREEDKFRECEKLKVRDFIEA